MSKLFALMRKAGWNLGDQILSALSNVVLSIVIARSVDAPTFGAFSIAFLVFGIGIAVTRSVVGQPLQIRYAARSPHDQRAAMGRAHGLAVLIGLFGSVVCVVAGLLIGGSLATALYALAVCFPGLLLQDSQRLTFFAVGKAWGAVVIDTVWTVVQFAALGVLIATGATGLFGLILAWGLSATLASVVGMILLRSVPRPWEGFAWLVETPKLTGYLLAEYVLGLGASQVGILLVGVIAAAEAVGSLRAAQTLLGPLGILGAACFSFTVPEIARRPHLTPAQRRLAGHLVSIAMGVVTAAYVGILLVIPDWLGRELFADSWAGAQSVLLALGLSSLFSALANGIAGVLYGLGRAEVTFRINLMKAPVIVVAVIGGTLWHGAVGAAWGMALAELFVLPLWYRAFRKACDEPPAPVDDSPAHPEEDVVPGQPAGT